MKNIIPKIPSILNAVILGSKARVTHSSLIDYDAESVACYVYVTTKGESDYVSNNSFSAVYRVEKSDVNFFDVPIPTINSTQEYVIEIGVVDALAEGATGSGSTISNIDREGNVLDSVENELVTGKVSTAINLSSAARLNNARGAYLTSVVVVSPDTISGNAPPYLVVSMSGDNIETTRFSSVAIQVATGYNGSTISGLTWDTVYSGNFTRDLNISTGLSLGETYVFRLVTTFPDGSVRTEYYDSDLDSESLEHPLLEVDFNSVLVPPDNFDALNFEAYTSWDGTPTYDLLVTWSWLGSEDRAARHFEVQYLQDNSIIDSTDITSLDWSSPVKFTIASTSDRLFVPSVAYGNRFAFRIRAVGWGSEENKYSDWFYSKVAIGSINGISFNIIPSDSTAPIGTNIQVNDSGIYAYKDWGTAQQSQTFSIDASTGSITIGENGEFVYDAPNSTLSVDGSAVINDITAASIVMDWLGGVAPTIRTSNKTDFAQGGSGLWAGYADETTFKFDLGDSSKYIRWDGSELKISGGVEIDIPDDPSTLPPGSIGYTTLSLAATNNIVLFNGDTNTLREDPTVINLNANTNGNSNFVSNLVWEVLDSDSNDVTSSLLSEQYTGAPNSAKKLTISSGNGGLSSYNNLTVRVYFSPDSETWATSNIKDFTNIGKVRTYDNVEGLEEPFYAYLTNEAHPVPVDANNENPYLTDASGNFKLYQGTSDLSTDPSTSYSVVNADGCTVNLTNNNYSVQAVPLSGGVPTKDTYNITLRASYDTGDTIITYDRVFSLFISKQGPKGDPGESAKSLILSSDSYVFKFNSSGTPLNNLITLTANTQNIGSSVDWQSTPSVTLSGSGNERTLSAASFGSNDIVTITASAEGFSDTIRIVRIEDGGQGDDGEDSYTVILTNEAHSIPTDQVGQNPDLSGTGTRVIVYRGTTKLQSANPGSLSGLSLGEYDVQASNSLPGMSESTSGSDAVFSDASSGFAGDTHQITYDVHIATPGSYITVTKLQTFTKSKQGNDGPEGPGGPTGSRAPSWFEASTGQNPTQSSVWSGGTSSHAYNKLIEVAGTAIAYDTLTLYNASTPSLTDTFMWNGATWESAVKINGNIIADGTVRARAIAADEGFFEEINVNRIYNHGGNSGNYKMMIDFQNGSIHIRGSN